MALGITASLIGVYSPRTVQIVVTGLTVGASYDVSGSWSGGSWPVRAGIGVAESVQLVLSDIATPINTPISYTVTQNGQAVSTASLTVTYGHMSVLQSLSGDLSVKLDIRDNGAPRELALRETAFAIPGRDHPVVRYDISAGETGELQVNTDGADTRTLKALLKAGAPLLLRTNGEVCDLEATAFLSFTAASGSLLVGTRRRWRLGYRVIDDPEPDTVVGLPTYADYDAAYAGLSFADYDDEWAGLTYGDYDVHDWATRAAT